MVFCYPKFGVHVLRSRVLAPVVASTPVQLETLSENQMNAIINQIREIGSIRRSVVLFDHQLKPEHHGSFIKQGISPMIVPSDEDIHMALECMDVLYTQHVDIMCLGIIDEMLLPVISTIRESTEIMLVTTSKDVIKNCLVYADYLIEIKNLVRL